MGIFPVWGFQLIIGIPLAILFKMNKVLFIAAANISIPPMIPAIIYLSYLTGGFFVKHGLTFNSLDSITLQSINIYFLQYCVGAVVLAIGAGLLFFIVSYYSFSLSRGKK